jgi:putative membrane protein insertion efficiency factor
MRHLAIALIRLYQLTLAPLLRGHCRFHPSCSQYAVEAFERHGFVRGLGLAIRRLSRCHPLGTHGADPVP